jgi:hypothetical protein
MMSAWRRHRLRIHGPRGVALIGLSVVAFTFGLGYSGALIQVPHNTSSDLLAMLLPLPIWGILWCITGFHLLTSATKVDQGSALGGITALFFMWGTSQVTAAIVDGAAGRPSTTAYGAIIYYGMMVCMLGLAKMVNPGAKHLTITEAPGPAVDCGADNDER